MRKLVLIFVLLLVCKPKESKSQFLFDFINLGIGIIQTANEGGYEGRLTLLNNTPAILHGVKAVWHAGNNLNLGYTLHFGNNVVNSLTGSQRYRMYTINTGFYGEYILKGRYEKGFISIPVNFDIGSFYIPPTYVPVDESNATGYFSVEPRVQVNKPLTKWCLVSASGGYRFVWASKLFGTNNSGLGGPSLNLSLVFGNFE